MQGELSVYILSLKDGSFFKIMEDYIVDINDNQVVIVFIEVSNNQFNQYFSAILLHFHQECQKEAEENERSSDAKEITLWYQHNDPNSSQPIRPQISGL